MTQQGAQLGITLIVARVLGEEALGRFVIAYAVLVLLGLLALAGFRATLNRFVAQYVAQARPDRIRALVRFSVLTAGSASIVLGGGLVASAGPLSAALDDPALEACLVLVGLALPACTVRDLCLSATQGWRDQRAFAIIGWILEPVARLVLVCAFLAAGLGVTWVLVAVLAGSWAAAIAAAWALRRRLGARPLEPGSVPIGAIARFTLTTWGTSLAATGLVWADTLLLGALGDAAMVGVYAVATRLVALAIFVAAPIDALFAPVFAHHVHTRDRVRLGEAYRAATAWTLRLALPAFVAVVVLTEPLLEIFGAGFAAGSAVTYWLVCGQVVNAATGPVGSLLNMSGYSRPNFVTNLVTLALNIALNLALITEFGMVGAAAAWTCSLVVGNLAKAAVVWRRLRLVPVGLAATKATLAAAASVAVVLPFSSYAAGSVLLTAMGVVAVYVVYGAFTLVLGLSAAERAVVVATISRLTGRPAV